MFVLRLKFPSLTQLTISGSPGLQHTPTPFSAENHRFPPKITVFRRKSPFSARKSPFFRQKIAVFHPKIAEN
jgi:hypothetical protein